MALRAYGNWLYCSGGSLYSLRHTLLAAQRMYVELRPYSRLVWELISRWERAEPPQHRTPVPEPVLKAIVSYAWMSGFRSFAGVTLLAYYGLGRIGEVIQCRRSDLLLPSDDLWDQGSAAFLRLGSSKTATRGRPRVQHLKIVDETAVLLLTQVFSALPRSQPLFSQSPAAYRYRWNKVLKALNLEVELRLTPGGLRGGGAVEAYRRGLPVSEIQWRLKDPCDDVRLSAAWGLSRMPKLSRAAALSLARCLEDPAVRSFAVEALSLRGDLGASVLATQLASQQQEAQQVATSGLQKLGEAGARAAAEMLSHESPAGRRRAAELLASMGPAASRALAPSLRDKDADLRRRAAEVLGRLGSAAAGEVKALSRLLEDPNPYARISAARSLRAEGLKEAASAAGVPEERITAALNSRQVPRRARRPRFALSQA
ncbi:hypothetical protein AK812_SmicGene21084 [Symbiodinium microadriaticum]|uniref:HEAT repeat domain-containing protein n=1 Tax=Symbiodinium microadriaticum TaxID=2951 RepID=A0A1Q9DN97_SYMMI|nr:hypothetical protein AK812_SmicGene21084 [Symbiodinium microadriaticum]